MDHFLDKLTGKHDDAPKASSAPPQPLPATSVAHPSQASPAPGHLSDTRAVVNESHTQTIPSATKADDSSFSFSKLKDALIGGSEKPHQPDLPSHLTSSAPGATTPGRGDWQDKVQPDFIFTDRTPKYLILLVP
jgi:hypothetical protein